MLRRRSPTRCGRPCGASQWFRATTITDSAPSLDGGLVTRVLEFPPTPVQHRSLGMYW